MSLVYILMAIAFLFVVVGSVTALGVASLDASSQQVSDKQASYAANAGVQFALRGLYGDNNYAPPLPATPPTKDQYTVLPNGSGQYSVQVINNFMNGTTITDLPGPHGVTVPKNFIYILSYGQDAAARTTRQVGLLVKAGHMFDYGMFGKDSIKLGGGAQVDSFNSDNLPYGLTPTSTLHNSANLQIGTDGTQAAVVTVDGSNVNVYGSAYVGPGADLSTAFNYNGASSTTFSGTTGTLPCALNFPVVTPPTLTGPGTDITTSGTFLPGSYSSINLNSHASITLKAGTYYITGDVSLRGGSTINTENPPTGPVKLYFAGKFDISGGAIVNPSMKATNFQIYGTATAQSTATDATLTGGSTSAFTFYAPNSDVKLVGGQTLYGAVVGNTIVDSGGSNVHVDNATQNLNIVWLFEPAGWQSY